MLELPVSTNRVSIEDEKQLESHDLIYKVCTLTSRRRAANSDLDRVINESVGRGVGEQSLNSRTRAALAAESNLAKDTRASLVDLKDRCSSGAVEASRDRDGHDGVANHQGGGRDGESAEREEGCTSEHVCLSFWELPGTRRVGEETRERHEGLELLWTGPFIFETWMAAG